MKLLVLAQTPPPLHGQSLMVQTLVKGLPAHGVTVHHVNLGLSRDAADIGRWRLGKILGTLAASGRALAARFVHGCDTLYYVPAPGRRGALYRDWTVMLLCRPFFRSLVLHWHAPGLGAWLHTGASALERWLTQLLLGRARLSLVLTPALQDDARVLRPRQVAIVANGIADPHPPARPLRAPETPFEILFLGRCEEDKGLFDLATAVLGTRAPAGGGPFHLTVAGAFPDSATAARFAGLVRENPDRLRHAGFVDGDAKRALLLQCDCLALPTRYAQEGQPLVLLEALAYDRPVVASRWRGIPETLPTATSWLVEPGDVRALTAALEGVRRAPPPAGAQRAWYLANFQDTLHLERMAAVLREL